MDLFSLDNCISVSLFATLSQGYAVQWSPMLTPSNQPLAGPPIVSLHSSDADGPLFPILLQLLRLAEKIKEE